MIRRFFYNAGILAVTEIFIRLKGLIVLPLLTRHLGVHDFGVWSQIALLAAVFAPVATLGTENALVRFLPGEPRAFQARLFTGWLMLAGIGAIICVFVVLAADVPISNLLFGKDYKQVLILFPFLALNIVTVIYINALRLWARLQNQVWLLVLVSFTQAAVYVLIVVLSVVGGGDIYDLVRAVVVGDFAVLSAMMLLFTIKFSWGRPVFRDTGRYVKFGLVALPAAYGELVINLSDRLFLAQMSGIASVGIYSFSYGLGYIIFALVIGPIWTMYSPLASEYFNRNDTQGGQYFFETTAGIVLLIGLPMGAGLLIVGDRLTHAMATPEFLTGSAIIGLICFAYVFHILAAFFGTAVTLSRGPGLASAVNLFCAAVNMGLNWLLIPVFGAVGAALATLSAFVLALVILYAIAWRHRLLRVNFMFVAKVSANTAFMYGVLYGVRAFLPDVTFIKVPVLTLLGVMLYAAVSLLTRTVSWTQVWRELEQLKANLARGRRMMRGD
ncbi:oligosaccharide flippase family protein [Varunaivibrio sulfuroxidans]|uniref:O-antigen/teichoic acid export membrane protein n=1 Tax=Varunaivibrio sulfuroxidans TaxID=1773489 RepID=A0A4R3J6S8_9PROT|nr:oligosaccharide flippase family protein [Varunaivibrio sulfuroxidans]TCS60573.1 O-antigen/teichoic acid export membrane protein [Varunaivibrio sulfuroxidans]WES30063.1 oligosaccharide flippase family protein [Varunaivibrio sulfuroxidans]